MKSRTKTKTMRNTTTKRPTSTLTEEHDPMTTMISDEIDHAAADAQAATLMELDAFIDAGLAAARCRGPLPSSSRRDGRRHLNRCPRRSPSSRRLPRPLAVAAELDPRAARKLDGLLRMADAYRASGSLRQAMEMYYELAAGYLDAPQGREAEDRLLDIARDYERAGELRQARAIYERLL